VTIKGFIIVVKCVIKSVLVDTCMCSVNLHVIFKCNKIIGKTRVNKMISIRVREWCSCRKLVEFDYLFIRIR